MSRPVPADDAPRPSWGFRLVARLAIIAVRLGRWRITTSGLEHVPRRGGAVIAWNHHSHVDFVVTLWDVYRQLGRPVRILAMRELWHSWRTRWIVKLADAVPVDRVTAGAGIAPYEAAVEALRAGHLVAVAAEGRISTSFELLPFRSGVARMALAAGVPIVPSVSWGSHRLVTTGHRFSPRRAYGIPVTVRFGPPLHPAPGQRPVTLTRELHLLMRDMLDEVQRSYPDGYPADAWWVPARLGGGAPPLRLGATRDREVIEQPTGPSASRGRRRSTGSQEGREDDASST